MTAGTGYIKRKNMNTNSDPDIRKVISEFDPISLDQMGNVELMRRKDTKYVCSRSQLPFFLEQIRDDYYVLEIEEEREHAYETTYFDTNDFSMYKMHHNGKLNRHKIRVRRYVYTNKQFLEIKRKNNKGETIKKRIENSGEHTEQTINGDGWFVAKYTPYESELLEPKLGNKFIRITLVNKELQERVTLDYKLNFTDIETEKSLTNESICIIEIKRNLYEKNSAFAALLKNYKVYPMGFSKYCVGVSLLQNSLKQNNFKSRINKIQNFK